jgi:16S rRNA (adenine1518-N6/adenine1519-N6)-dimethyltransferase
LNNPIAKKRFGQNFLSDLDVIDRIVRTIAPSLNDHFFEIGPGLGALTKALLPHTSSYEAMEIDRDLVKILRSTFPAIHLHEGDILDFDFSQCLRSPVRVVGNLPYNISSPLLFHCLKYMAHIQDFHFMLQKEVADRIAAAPHQKDYGRLSVMMQVKCKADICFDVPKEAFTPAPQVTSAFIRLTPRHDIAINNEAQFAHIVRQAFCQRRKTLAKSLKGLVSPALFEAAHIDPKLRPENLSVMDFVNLSNKASTCTTS